MTMPDAARERLAFLLETVELEAAHLQATDQRLFAQPFTTERAAMLRCDALLAQAVNEAHDNVPMLVRVVQTCRAYVAARQLA